jgi:hypothetical protein
VGKGGGGLKTIHIHTDMTDDGMDYMESKCNKPLRRPQTNLDMCRKKKSEAWLYCNLEETGLISIIRLD